MKKILLCLMLLLCFTNVVFADENLLELGLIEPFEVTDDIHEQLCDSYFEYQSIQVQKASVHIYNGYVYAKGYKYDKVGDDFVAEHILCRIDLKTGELENIRQEAGDLYFQGSFWILDDLIYLTAQQYDTKLTTQLYSMHLDGTNLKKVQHDEVQRIYFNNDQFYLAYPTLSRYNYKTQNFEMIEDKIEKCLDLESGILYLSDDLHFINATRNRIIPGFYEMVYSVSVYTDDFFFLEDQQLKVKNAVYLNERTLVETNKYQETNDTTIYFEKDVPNLSNTVKFYGSQDPRFSIILKEKGIPYTFISDATYSGNNYTLLVEDYLYFYQIEKNMLYQLNLKTLKSEVLLETNQFDFIGSDSTHIYYRVGSDAFRMLHDGTELTKIKDNIKDIELLINGLLVIENNPMKPYILSKDGSQVLVSHFGTGSMPFIVSVESDGVNSVLTFRDDLYYYDATALTTKKITNATYYRSTDDGIVAYSTSNSVHLYDVKTGITTTLFDTTTSNNDNIRGFYRDGFYYYIKTKIVQYGEEGELLKVNVETLKEERLFATKDFTKLSYSQNDYLSLISPEKMLQTYDTKTGDLSVRYIGNKSIFHSLGDFEVFSEGHQAYSLTYAYNIKTGKVNIAEGLLSQVMAFRDVPEEDVALNAALLRLKEAGIVSGSGNEAKVNDSISRAETATILIKLLDSMQYDYSDVNITTFDDVTQHDWYYNYVHVVRALNLVGGIGNNLYDPNSNMTDTQLAIILSKIMCMNDQFKLPNKYDNMHWQEIAQSASTSFGIINSSQILSNEPITRGEAFLMMDRVYQVLLEQHIQNKVNGQ